MSAVARKPETLLLNSFIDALRETLKLSPLYKDDRNTDMSTRMYRVYDSGASSMTPRRGSNA